MKLYLSIIISALIVTSIIFQGCKQSDTNKINIIPKPNQVTAGKGCFKIDNSTVVLVEEGNDEASATSEYLVKRIEKASGLKLKISSTSEKKAVKGAILLTSFDADPELGDEGYIFKSDKNSVVLRGKPAGLFYSVQTLFQLLPPEIYKNEHQTDISWSIPSVTIKDKPRFKWRGMHLDVGRHFFPTEFIKKYIDYLAMHKMNTFHWHLTEDQGWRIEIEKYPLLNKIGSWRRGTTLAELNKPDVLDGIPHGGYYTKDEIREIVRYAGERYITVVPEIELPGHSQAALAAYPQLSCKGEPLEVKVNWGISDDIYCAGNDEVFAFLEDVLSEVIELFPSKYIHIGGDEAPKVRWKECPKCQKRIFDENLKDEEGLQSYFIGRIEKFINSKGRQIIGWDEILQGGLAPNASVMSWRGEKGGIEVAKQNKYAVMCPSSHCYFDHYQGDEAMEPRAFGGYTPLEKTYSYEPVPEALTVEQSKYILGAQGNVWTEFIKTPQQVEYMAMPRMCALAEVVWSEKEQRDLDDFLRRLTTHYSRLDNIGTNYRWPQMEGFKKENIFIGHTEINLKKGKTNSVVRYTIDGTDPDNESPVFSKPIKIDKTTLFKAVEFVPGGYHSRIYEGTFIKQPPYEPMETDNIQKGINFQYFEFDKAIDLVADLDKMQPVKRGSYSKIAYPYDELPELFGLKFNGFIQIPSEGVYTFTVQSNDGSRLFIHGKEIVENDGWHGSRERYGQIALKAGLHPISLNYFQCGGGKALKIFIEGPGISKKEIGEEMYFVK